MGINLTEKGDRQKSISKGWAEGKSVVTWRKSLWPGTDGSGRHGEGRPGKGRWDQAVKGHECQQQGGLCAEGPKGGWCLTRSHGLQSEHGLAE